jgi:tetratricopeptide (TPR) repeat protein
MADSAARKVPVAKRRYLIAALLLSAAVFGFGWILNAWMTQSATIPLSSTRTIEQNGDANLEQLFATAVRHMQQRQYQQALDLWHRALMIDPDIPEVKVNMGFALYELGEYTTARDFFINAMEQNTYQANAYYGLAISSEKLEDLEGALGAMRTYIHLAAGDQDEKFLRLARAALWEWEARLAGNPKLQDPAGDEAHTAGQ